MNRRNFLITAATGVVALTVGQMLPVYFTFVLTMEPE